MSADSTAPKVNILVLVPVLLCFLVMGFVDIIGIATNYVQKALSLTDAEANVFPSLLFFWFLIFSVPSALLMNRIGRKNTVLVSIAVNLLAVIIPLFGESYALMLIAFSLLGIGNTISQTSLFPLVSNIVPDDKLASAMTFGLFIKALTAFTGPVICAWGAAMIVPNFGYGWRVVFLVYAVVGAVLYAWLHITRVVREKSDKVSGFRECIRLLGDKLVFLSFLGIICHVGIDVGIITTAPRLFMERCGMSLGDAGYAVSIYFLCRLIGSLVGAGALQKFSSRIFFFGSTIFLALGLVGWLFLHSAALLYICVILLGLGNANVFPIIVAQALLRRPNEANEVSGLMIMGLFGGTVFPLIMGWASYMGLGQIGAVLVMLVGAFYLVGYTKMIRAQNA